MTAFALSSLRPAPSWFSRAPSLRAEHWLALAIVVAAITLPDCCLNGHHLFGAGMESFGPICRASL
jgi:hypothetical protein